VGPQGSQGAAGPNFNPTAKSANYTAAGWDMVIGTAGSGGFAVTAPSPAAVSGVFPEFQVSKADNGTGTISILAHGSDTFIGAAVTAGGRALTIQGDSVWYVSDGTNWHESDTTVANAAFMIATQRTRLDQMLQPANPVNFGAQAAINLGSGVVPTDAVRKDDNGWIQDLNTWTRVSNTSFSFPVNSSVYGAAMCAKWQESGVQKYAIVASSSPGSTTTVTICTTSDSVGTMAATPDAGTTFYSYGVPRDFPAAFTWSGIGATGLSGSLTVTSAFFSVLPGRKILLSFQVGGTSNATTFTITGLPITSAAAGSATENLGAFDNSNNTAAEGSISSNGTTIVMSRTTSGGSFISTAWTSSGTKGALGRMIYSV